jgi:ribosomal protein S18 acetylase RimI-like enzyme
MQIREATLSDAAGIARVHVDTWRSAYREIVPDAVLDELSYEQKTEFWERVLAPTNPTFAYVAEDPATQQIVGFVSGGPAMDKKDMLYKGELFTLYILDAYQRRGLGQRLFFRTVERLIEMGLTSMLIWVLAENPARRFYEALGGQHVKTQPYEVGGITLQEVGYGWQFQSLTDLKQHFPTSPQTCIAESTQENSRRFLNQMFHVKHMSG